MTVNWTLFTYCIPYDDGAAPNPYWGACTLNICKPKIRLAARVGDWVVGTEAKSRGLEGKVVYAMKVTKKMTMQEYDSYTKASLLNKVPDWGHQARNRRLGDSIYDFSTPGTPTMRPGVHGVGNRVNDLSGDHTLLSTHFYYFGENAVELPEDLKGIIRQGRAHRSTKNNDYRERFLEWLEGLGYKPGCILGNPGLDLFADEIGCSAKAWCAAEEPVTEADD
jgi:Nucleotide modification associated domain 2